ncbi:MAG: VOC family protein [Defluviitaleaceae bacterium]|nr:VOC family protein [Defluviitaleaceae bacterium]
MILGVEFCMVVTNSIAALELYEKIFEVDRVAVNDLGMGSSGVIFNIYNARFQLMDQNIENKFVSPKQSDSLSKWINVAVPDIQKTYDAAIAAGCEEIYPVAQTDDPKVKTATFGDEYGHMWMLHEIDYPAQ